MKNNYVIKSDTNKGESFIRNKVFEDFIKIIVSKSKVARLSTRNKNKYGSEVRCYIKKDNVIHIDVDIAVKKGNDVKKSSEDVLNEINSNLFLTFETKPIVTLNVTEIDF